MNPPPDAEAAVPGLDPRAAKRWQQQPRSQSPWLHEEVAARMAERLPWFRNKPSSWLHWEPVSGGLQGHRRVCEWLPDARCHVAAENIVAALEATREPHRRTWSPLRWAQRNGPTRAEADTRVGMVWANMALHLEPKPQTLLRRWQAQIETNGLLMFSCLGPDTLRELREVYARQAWPAPAHPFTDMHDWGDMLVRSGFAEPVMDMERLTLSYSAVDLLLHDLRQIGRNLHAQRFPALRTRAWRERLGQSLEADLPRSPEGRLLLTVEIIYGHAFKSAPRVPLGSSASVSLADLRAMLRAGRG